MIQRCVLSLTGLILVLATVAPRTSLAAPKLPTGITVETKASIDRGLAYLARVQARDGSWSNRGRYGAYPVSMTALAGLAFLMDGNTTTQGRYAPQVDRATRYLLRAAQPNGEIALHAHEGRPMYGHGFSMLFLSQLYGMTEDADRARELHGVLTRGVELISRSQSTEGGWYYTADARTDEGSVTITQVQALRSCRNVGIAVPKQVIDTAMAYLARSQNSDGGIRYAVRQIRGQSRPAITAAAICCWYNAGQYTNPLAKRALKFCKEKVRPESTVGGHDFYAHFYFAQALFIADDPYWEEYYPRRRDFMLAIQDGTGFWNNGVGDIYSTATALVMLQLPYNQLPIMQQ